MLFWNWYNTVLSFDEIYEAKYWNKSLNFIMLLKYYSWPLNKKFKWEKALCYFVYNMELQLLSSIFVFSYFQGSAFLMVLLVEMLCWDLQSYISIIRGIIFFIEHKKILKIILESSKPFCFDKIIQPSSPNVLLLPSKKMYLNTFTTRSLLGRPTPIFPGILIRLHSYLNTKSK